MSEPRSLHVLLADDHAMVRDGLRSLIETDWPTAQFSEAWDESSTLASLVRTPPPELAIVDVRMPGMRGAASFAEFRRANPSTVIVVVSGLDDPGLEPSLLALGAAAVLSKEAPAATLLKRLHTALEAEPPRESPVPASPAIRAADSSGSHRLSERQRETLRLLHDGLPNKLIARRLGIAETTVKGHLHALYAALNVSSRAEAVARSRDWLL